MESLAGKVVIVTGGNSGIGKSIALKFASLGCQICITGRNSDRLKEVTKTCKEKGKATTKAIGVCGDIRDQEHRKAIIAETIKHFGRIDVLVNNAGVLCIKHITETTEQDYNDMFDVNVKACIFLTQLAIPHLKKTKGSIINTSSMVAVLPFASIGAYCMSKAALDMFTNCLAADLGPSGVRVNSVDPGITRTDIFERAGLPSTKAEEYFKTQASRNALGRVIVPEDCAEAAAFLASDAARCVTGQHIYVDGGRRCVVPDVV